MRELFTSVAALFLMTAGSVSATSRADDPTPPESIPPKVTNRVLLGLQISGLGSEGGSIEITPGHKGCEFEPLTLTAPKAGDGLPVRFKDIEVEASATNADRDCSFRIVVKQPGKKAKVYLRGLRLEQPDEETPMPEQRLRCYLSTPSVVSRRTEPPKR